MPSIQPRDGQLRIEFGRLLETLQCLFEKLLVHVGGAEIVQARSLGGIRFRLSLRRGREQDQNAASEHAGESN